MKVKDIKLNQWYDISHMSDGIGYIKVKEILWHDKYRVNLVVTQLLYNPRPENENTVLFMGSKIVYNEDISELDNLFSKPVDHPSFMPCIMQFCEDNDVRQPYDEIYEKGWNFKDQQ